MPVKIEFATTNAAFADHSFAHHEVARILHRLADRIEAFGVGGLTRRPGQIGNGPVSDTNGNRIGTWSATIDAESGDE